MPARYCSLSQQGHLQPHSKSRAWQLSTLLLNALQYYGLEKVLLLGREFGNITCKYSHISKKFFEDHQKAT